MDFSNRLTADVDAYLLCLSAHKALECPVFRLNL
jgi:hypothetical protein